MKAFSFSIFFAVAFLGVISLGSCKKDNRPQPEEKIKFEDYIGKYLICDSIVIRDRGVIDQTWRFGKGKGWDMTIKPDGTLEEYVDPQMISLNKYLFRQPDTLYRWHQTQVWTPISYVLVKMPSMKQFRTLETIGVRTKENFYTVE